MTVKHYVKMTNSIYKEDVVSVTLLARNWTCGGGGVVVCLQ